MTIEISDIANIERYQAIPIEFVVESRLDLKALAEGTLVCHPVRPYVKDYDACEEDRPDRLVLRFDPANWKLVMAANDGVWIGGALLSLPPQDAQMVRTEPDCALILDVRIEPEFRGQGVGLAVLRSTLAFAKDAGCRRVYVETQDTNVPACRLYRALGGQVDSTQADGYGTGCDEAKLIWRFDLVSR